MSNDKYRFETLAVHGGQVVEPDTLSRGVPVYRTTSYLFKNTEHAANLFALKELGNIYTRLMNPTHDVLEKRISQLEGGLASVAQASGTAAIFNTVITIARAGDEIVSAGNLYGGTYTMFEAILPQFNITTRFVNHADLKSYESAINDKTRLVFIETIGNPSLDFTDIAGVAAIARKHNLPLVVDATFTTPYLLRTIEHGANIVINSATKWIGGHGAAIGGVVTDAGNFNWQDKKFTLFTEPDNNYHGLRWASDLPAPLAPIAFALRLRTVPLRNLGACISPDNAWILLQGVESLPVRMERHCSNALAVAQFLKGHRQVAWVRYPGLPSDPAYPVASKYLKRGFGGMVVFGVKGGYAAAVKLIDSIGLFSHLANVGDAESLILHPSSTSHSQLSEEQQRQGGLTPDLVRLSIGLEHIDDLIAALDEGLQKAH
ncbi:MAG: O-acetylhomoserine aminocarboxypropyltransferase/cysteine synthase [Chitinivibrionales bacterium]|nr:O-acetylhomoserine aminocarboxypropyltransferase/cysteine synthase [Chitinivibrionales bacterium]